MQRLYSTTVVIRKVRYDLAGKRIQLRCTITVFFHVLFFVYPFYKVPHLDPCDATILVCLKECEEGGDTCFPMLNYRHENSSGNGLLFFSSNSINGSDEKNVMALHHGGKVCKGEKIIVQMMLDWNGQADPEACWLDVVLNV